MNTKHATFRLLLLLPTLIGAACSDDKPTAAPSVVTPVASIRLARYEGSGQHLDGEQTINDLHVCHFESGRLTAVHEHAVTSEDGSYNLPLEQHAGTLYVVANTKGLIDWDALQRESLTEAEWLKRTVATGSMTPPQFSTCGRKVSHKRSNAGRKNEECIPGVKKTIRPHRFNARYGRISVRFPSLRISPFICASSIALRSVRRLT